MKQTWTWTIISASILVILLSPILFEKRTVPIISNGNIVAVAKQPFSLPWNDYKVEVFVGKSKAFSLWADFFDSPRFIYPFADGQRYLCDYSADTADLIFIVDFGSSRTNVMNTDKWPSDDWTRTSFAKWITNVCCDTKGVVRLPNYSELQEASSNLVSLTSWQRKTTSFPCRDLGFLRFYQSKEDLIYGLRTNRELAW